MTGTWRESYRKLEDYIEHHDGIEILPESVCMAGEVRPGFYHLFEKVNREFTEEHFPRELAKARRLSSEWQQIKEDVINQLKLTSVDVPLHLTWFLDNPLEGMSRTLFDPLFDVLKGREDVIEFEVKEADALERNFARFFHEGYRRWAILALIKALASDRLLEVKGQDLYNDANLADGTGTGIPSGEVPEPITSSAISFIEAPVNAFLVPKIIAHSKNLNKYISLRPDFHESSWNARSYSDKQEWLGIPAELQKSDKARLWPDMVLHVAEDARDLSLVADFSHIARPDVSLEFRESEDWYTKEDLDNIKLHAATLKPRRGTFVLCLEPLPEAALNGLPGDIRLLPVGYDPIRLEPIVKALGSAD